ncbi:MAG: hypothetical protein OEZ24_01230, partial [Candidatus Bathyarchaeota archaeon]|nr:hypothetical protein [Candidatus Bathyarchaeota archaeon]
QGVGSLLLGRFCEYVDELEQAAYLEIDSIRNVHLYERFGFSIIAETTIFLVPNRLMSRPVASK